MAEPTWQDGATRTLSEDDFAVGITERYFEDYATGAVYEYGYASITEADRRLCRALRPSANPY
jgi:hypothetical protein